MMSLCRGPRWRTKLRAQVATRNQGMTVGKWEPWPNSLPADVLRCVDCLVDYHEFPMSGERLDVHDMGVIIAQAAYDAGKRQG